MQDWSEFILIERLTGSDDRLAEEAFVSLVPRIRAVMIPYLRKYVEHIQDRDDIVMTAVSRMWTRRTQVSFASTGEWWSYLAKACTRIAFDSRKASLEDEYHTSEFLAEEHAAITSASALTWEKQRMYAIADAVWLGVDIELPAKFRDYKSLAAQLKFMSKLDSSQVARLLSQHASISPNDVNQWCQEGSTMNMLAFHHLYIDNNSLACELIHGEGSEFRLDVSQYLRKETPPGAPMVMRWTPAQTRAIVLKYKNGLQESKILQMDPGISSRDLETVAVRCAELLPFARRAQQLTEILGEKEGKSLLAKPGLWRRLVFQYLSHDELPHKQIYERTSSAAAVGGFALTEHMVATWIGNNRLVSQLAKYAENLAHG